MQGSTVTPRSTPTTTACGVPASAGPRPCPACSAPLVQLRGQFRCTRCHFTFCVGCEDGPGVQPEDE